MNFPRLRRIISRFFVITIAFGLVAITASAQYPLPSGTAPQAASSAPVPAPAALAPKVPGKMRVCVAPAQAQVGQGNDLQGDYGTPIRNYIVLTMSGPAVEIAGLDSRLPIQVQAEGQQKECDYVVYPTVSVKHSGGGFGKLMKSAAPAAGVLTGGIGGRVAQTGQAASTAIALTAQEQVMNQLAGFNGQVKSKDDVAFEYQLLAAGQDKPKLQESLKGKAKSDGEDVLTPLLQQAANKILIEVTKK